MTPEELAKIEARADLAINGGWYEKENVIEIVCEQDIPTLIATLKEAWAENERLKNAAIQTPKFFRWGT